MLWNVVAGDVARSGLDQRAAVKLLEEVAVSLGNPLRWTAAARAMGMASGRTAREYVGFMAASFVLLTVYFWDLSGGSLQPAKQRKVYYMDPLYGRIAPALMPGARRPPDAGVIENLVATTLFRSAAHALTQADAVPGAVGYWRSRNGRELDFVVPAEEFGRGGRLPVEVKGDGDSRLGYAKLAIARAFGSGIVASRSVLDLSGDVPVIPVPVLLAGLREVPERSMSIG